jgi:hypothetical protein
MAGYLTAYIDRVNVGFAALTANKDLGSQWFSSASDLGHGSPPARGCRCGPINDAPRGRTPRSCYSSIRFKRFP